MKSPLQRKPQTWLCYACKGTEAAQTEPPGAGRSSVGHQGSFSSLKSRLEEGNVCLSPPDVAASSALLQSPGPRPPPAHTMPAPRAGGQQAPGSRALAKIVPYRSRSIVICSPALHSSFLDCTVILEGLGCLFGKGSWLRVNCAEQRRHRASSRVVSHSDYPPPREKQGLILTRIFPTSSPHCGLQLHLFLSFFFYQIKEPSCTESSPRAASSQHCL